MHGIAHDEFKVHSQLGECRARPGRRRSALPCAARTADTEATAGVSRLGCCRVTSHGNPTSMAFMQHVKAATNAGVIASVLGIAGLLVHTEASPDTRVVGNPLAGAALRECDTSRTWW